MIGAKCKYAINITVPYCTFSEKLKVHVTPQFQVMNAGSAASFQCKASGHPIEKIMWTVNGKSVAPNLAKKNTVTIQSVQRSDEGMYQCFVISDRNTIQGTAQLKLGSKCVNLF